MAAWCSTGSDSCRTSPTPPRGRGPCSSTRTSTARPTAPPWPWTRTPRATWRRSTWPAKATAGSPAPAVAPPAVPGPAAVTAAAPAVASVVASPQASGFRVATSPLEQEIEQAYLHYWDVRTAAYLSLDTSQLGEVMAGA